jgi:hypothetical protein
VVSDKLPKPQHVPQQDAQNLLAAEQRQRQSQRLALRLAPEEFAQTLLILAGRQHPVHRGDFFQPLRILQESLRKENG